MAGDLSGEKRERDGNPPDDDSEAKRRRALAAFKAQAAKMAAMQANQSSEEQPQHSASPAQFQQPQAHEPDPQIQRPRLPPPRFSQTSTSEPNAIQGVSSTQHQGGAATKPQQLQPTEAAGEEDTWAEGETEDAWAGDHDARDATAFDADAGQDFDHELQVDEQNWESENFALKLPPGWAKCPNAGTEVPGTSMFPIKAPFGGKPGQRVPPAYQWKPSDVLAHMREVHGARVGLVVDFTMSLRYYKPQEFEELGVQHVKIKCKGHGEVPAPEDVNRFIWEVRRRANELQIRWQQEKELLARYDQDVKDFNAEQLQATQQPAAAAAQVKPKHPLQKLNRIQQRVVQERELVMKRPPVTVVHCTHGYNRSGYMVVHFLMRASPLARVADCIQRFADARKPGMYKDEYIQALFRYYRQPRPESGPDAIETPLVPMWKPGDESPEHFADSLLKDEDNADREEAAMQHDDPIGEEIHEEEAQMYRADVVNQLRVAFLKLPRSGGADEDGVTEADLSKLRNFANRLEFPGSQPVSLSCDNQHLIHSHRYWFTWKADGTRYMAYLCHSGMYLIDRRMRVTRVQMRFPLWPRPGAPTDTPQHMAEWLKRFQQGRLPNRSRLSGSGLALHHATLVEGEMVVDTRPDGKQERVLYIYDLMVLNGCNVIGLPWKQRYLLMREVTEPRDEEAKQLLSPAAAWPHSYSYAAETFRVKLKTFWPLHALTNVRRSVFPAIRHENDGLILQAYEAKYIPDVCNMLLKWKPASHNSVDFTLLPASHRVVAEAPSCAPALARGQDLFLGVYAEGRVIVAYDVDHAALRALRPEESLKKALTDTPARVAFPPGVEAGGYHGMVIECSFDEDRHEWVFMRDRAKDKDTPNALNTYLKVIKSIVSAIDDDDISEQFALAYRIGADKYKKDKAAQEQERRRRAH